MAGRTTEQIEGISAISQRNAVRNGILGIVYGPDFTPGRNMPSYRQLAKRLRTDASLSTIHLAVGDLEEAGVLGKRRDGTVYTKRKLPPLEKLTQTDPQLILAQKDQRPIVEIPLLNKGWELQILTKGGIDESVNTSSGAPDAKTAQLLGVLRREKVVISQILYSAYGLPFLSETATTPARIYEEYGLDLGDKVTAIHSEISPASPTPAISKVLRVGRHVPLLSSRNTLYMGKPEVPSQLREVLITDRAKVVHRQS